MLMPQRGKIKRRRQGRTLRRVGLIGVVAVGLIIYQTNRQFQPVNSLSRRVVYVSVKPGQAADSIGYELHQKGVIRSTLAFQMALHLMRASRQLKVGVYRVSPANSVDHIIRMMESGKSAVIRITFPEGFRVKQVVARLVSDHVGTTQSYETILHHPLPGMPSPGAGVTNAFEGYLFPATYSFPWGSTPRQVVSLMWQNFKRETQHVNLPRNMSVRQWVTLASIVQAEAPNAQAAPKIAGVFLNRLGQHMPLQSDATVRYAMGRVVSGGLSSADLQVASPYNTYVHVGLPPGPIDNPGWTSLHAVLHPVKSTDLYFYTLPNRKVLYAKTYAQQLANIRKR